MGSGKEIFSARAAAFDENTWILGVRLFATHPARATRASLRFHFVLDNSGSMGQNSRVAKDCFADLVELATEPCSLVAFRESASLLGDSFTTPNSMRSASLPGQGGTNITAGVEKGLEVITRCERACPGKTHHVLVLLSDGAHNQGPKPQEMLPQMGAVLRSSHPVLRLSVVVIGVTGSSDTSMGMLLKHSLETMPLQALQPIYFTQNAASMRTALGEMSEALACLSGTPVSVALTGGCTMVRTVGGPAVERLDVLAGADEHSLLVCGESPPEEILVDGEMAPVTLVDFDVDLAVDALQALISDLRVQRVAFGAAQTHPAVQQLGSWIETLESRCSQNGAGQLQLSGASPATRLAQYKALKRVSHDAKELRNELECIQALSANDSSSQAAFLTGASSKFGAKALRRAANRSDAAAVDPAARRAEIVSDLQQLAPRIKSALRQDFCAKVAMLEERQRQELRNRLCLAAPAASDAALDAVCSAEASTATLPEGGALTALVDGGGAFEILSELCGSRQSFLSLQSLGEHLKDWWELGGLASSCQNEYELLMCAGFLGYPIEVQRSAATQMDPFAMTISRVLPSLADTASLLTALRSDHPVIAPEGGEAIEDLLVLVDPDAPRASRVVANSMLLREAYTSVVLCRDLHMFTGNKMREALHAHALLSSLQPPSASSEGDTVAHLRRQYMGRAFQCPSCHFGPIDHYGCYDLQSHHMAADSGGGVARNSCPRCDWFSEDLSDWPAWDGTVPKEALPAAAGAGDGRMTSVAAEIALRICYSARAILQTGGASDLGQLCERLASWETLTTADGVDHPVQLLLALAVLDDVPEAAFRQVSLHMLLNEICARRARRDLRRDAGCDESKTAAAARHRVCAFLGIDKHSSPQAAPLGVAEPQRSAVAETCSCEFTLDSDKYNFKSWVQETLMPWEHGLRAVHRLRKALASRGGGWRQLARDMEKGPAAFADVIEELTKPRTPRESLRALLGIGRPSDAERVLAAMTAQAFMHNSSQHRRSVADGGALLEPLGDPRDVSTLRGLCRDLRMAFYEDGVAAKMREWGQVGASMTYQRAFVADLDQFSRMWSGHVHGLDGPTFWGLWRAAKAGGHDKARMFLATCNQGFLAKYG